MMCLSELSSSNLHACDSTVARCVPMSALSAALAASSPRDCTSLASAMERRYGPSPAERNVSTVPAFRKRTDNARSILERRDETRMHDAAVVLLLYFWPSPSKQPRNGRASSLTAQSRRKEP